MVRKILNDNKDKLLAFNKATSFIGFASSLFETICFYKSCNVSPDEIYVDDSMSFANLKQKDIKLIYSKYENFLQTEFTDSFNQLKLFADSINKDTFQNTIFYFVEFDDFTRIMYEIILKLSRFSEGIYLTCLYGKDNNNSNIFSNKVYYDLIDIYKSEGLEYKIIRNNLFNDKSKSFLLNNLLSYNPEKINLDHLKISIRSFNNISDEIKYTISDMYTKLIGENLNLDNFAIVVPS